MRRRAVAIASTFRSWAPVHDKLRAVVDDHAVGHDQVEVHLQVDEPAQPLHETSPRRCSANAELTATQKAAEVHVAALQQHVELLEEALHAARQVGTDAPPGAITVPPKLADDPRFAEARRLTRLASGPCRK